MALRKNKQFVDEAGPGDLLGLILDRTNFYAEQGGQIYDTGFMQLVGNEDVEFAVTEVHLQGGYVVHIGRLVGGIQPNGFRVPTLFQPFFNTYLIHKKKQIIISTSSHRITSHPQVH